MSDHGEGGRAHSAHLMPADGTLQPIQQAAK